MQINELIPAMSALMTVSGYEEKSHGALMTLLDGVFDEITPDALGSLVCVRRCGRADAPRILIDAHIDEIGMMVTEILDGGFLRVTNLGGIDTRILPAAEVRIYGKETIEGVISAPPTYLLPKDKEKSLKPIGELFVDTGYEKRELEALVRLGTPVGFAPRYTELMGRRIAGKGFDDKSCAAAAVAALAGIDRAKQAGDVYLLLAVEEEVTMLGGKTGAAAVDPDYAMVVDVTFGEAPDTKKGEAFPLGGGCVISLSAATDRRLTNRVVGMAEKAGIPYHRSVEPGSTGTDANATQYALCGIPTVVASLPIRSMHTYHEMLDFADARSLADLIAAFVCDGGIAEEFAR